MKTLSVAAPSKVIPKRQLRRQQRLIDWGQVFTVILLLIGALFMIAPKLVCPPRSPFMSRCRGFFGTTK